MLFESTRGGAPAATVEDAIAAGLAPDGGLYVPHGLPTLDIAHFDGVQTLPDVATRLLAPFFAGSTLAPALEAICSEAFDFPVPVVALDESTEVLELFHGPTAAFKDIGARFLAACMSHLPRTDGRELTVLVATSGDTGAAVAAAFHGRPGLRVVILYPDGRVSARQAHQLGCFGGNVHALRVAGSFDDCQRMAKAALSDTGLNTQVPLTSANSISLGRLLPQMTYYAQASLMHWRATATRINLVIPTGNLGNGLAALWARAMGLPIGDIRLACNANRTLPAFFAGDAYRPREAIATLANAMDVGAPSNFERLMSLYHGNEEKARLAGFAEAVDDTDIGDVIGRHASHYLFCPHTATAMKVRERMAEAGDRRRWTIVATAHPAKFDSVVEPRASRAVPVPPALAAMLARPSHAEPMAADDDALREWLLQPSMASTASVLRTRPILGKMDSTAK
ncbi:threonine synthase [Pinirhizobacter sp.]|jgi:threonine synthase|uniref:threonine synthase n=1 Tax=Pinirhizobacter sp. TaxID=2950432 RepID=UPI002F41512A